MVCDGEGLKKVEDGEIHSILWGVGQLECGTFIKRNERNKERCMYFVCYFNGRWLKDSCFLCCLVILLSVEGRII